MSQKESEWESTIYIQRVCKVGYVQSIAVKNLISQVLSNREKEIAEEVKKICSCSSHALGCSGDISKDDVLKLLKH